MSDPQKKALYDWEDSFWGWDRNLVTLKKCREVIQFACGLYGVDPPKVRQHHEVSLSWSMPYAGCRVISLQAKGSTPGKGALNYPIALHEATHQIIWDYYGNTVQDHGPEFVGIYMWLLSKAGIVPFAALLTTLHDAGVSFTYLPPDKMPEKTGGAAYVIGQGSLKLLR